MLRAPLVLLLAVLASPAGSSNLVVPDFPDLTIKTRTVMGSHNTVEITRFFKGPRQRTEIRDPAAKNWVSRPGITQCDRGIHYSLNTDSKTYTSMPADPAEILRQWRESGKKAPRIEMSGAEVTITTDAVDTGERRQVGSFEARHVKTTITQEPGPGASSKPSKTEIDGWYIDLPGLDCRNSNAGRTGWVAASSGPRDRFVFKQLGTAPRGLAIEETRTTSQLGWTMVDKTELLKISEQPVDQSLFEIPADYSPARPSESSTPEPDAN